MSMVPALSSAAAGTASRLFNPL